MDADHEAELARILAKREARGHLLDRRAVTGRQTNAAAAAYDEATQRQIAERRAQEQQQASSQMTDAERARQRQQQDQADLTAQAQQLRQQQQQLDHEQHRMMEMQRQMSQQQNSRQNSNAGTAASGQSMSPVAMRGGGSGADAASSAAPSQQQQSQSMPGAYGASATRDGRYSTAAPSPSTQRQQPQDQSASGNYSSGRLPSQQQQGGQYGNAPDQQQQQQQQQQDPVAAMFEKKKFASFRDSPIITTDDIRTIRPYVKGQNHGAGARSVIQFGDVGSSSAFPAAGGAAGSSRPTSADMSGATPGGYGQQQQYQQQQQQGGRSVSQQRYPSQMSNNGATPGSRTPSVAQMASQARYGNAGGASARSIPGATPGLASGARSNKPPPGMMIPGSTRGGGRASTKEERILREIEERAAQISENNPFRTQTLEQYLVAPDEETVPQEVLQILNDVRNPLSGTEDSARSAVWNHKGEQLTAPMQGATVQPATGAPLFNFQAAASILVEGDWFLKWTRHKDKVHRRFFRVSQDGNLFKWGTQDPKSMGMSDGDYLEVGDFKVVRVSDIASIEPSSVVDENTDATVYVMTMWTTNRVLQLGTEYREKFDIWYETLRRLVQRQRKQNHAFVSRHATMVPESETAAATSMTMRQGMMGGKISSSD